MTYIVKERNNPKITLFCDVYSSSGNKCSVRCTNVTVI